MTSKHATLDESRVSGLPDLDSAVPEDNDSQAGSAGNSTTTKVLVVAVMLIVMVGAGVALKGLVFSPKEPAAETAADPVGEAAMPVGGGDALATTGIPLEGPLPAAPAEQLPATTMNLPAPGSDPVSEERLTRLEEALAEAQAAWQREAAGLSNDIQVRLTQIETSITALSGNIDTTSQPDNAEALAAIEARLQQFDSRLARLDRRSRDNWKELHGDAGAKRRGVALPFRIESIDWWDGAPSVVVRSGQDKQFIGIGDALAGWRLVSADPASGQVRFRRNGREAVAEVRQ